MNRKFVQSVASVLLVLIVLVVVLVVIGDTGKPGGQPEVRVQSAVTGLERTELVTAPRIRVLPSNNSVGLDNSTNIGIITMNPIGNDRSINVVVHFWIRRVSDVNVRVEGRLPKTSMPEHSDGLSSRLRGWEFVRTLDPNERDDIGVTVRKCSKPGTYFMTADVLFIKDGRWTRRSDTAVLTVENQPDSRLTRFKCDGERILGNFLTCARNLNQCVVDNEWAVMVLGIFLSIPSLDQFWTAVDWFKNR